MVNTTKKRVSIIPLLLILCLLATPLPALAKGIILNFTDVDISTMVKFMSDLTGKNFVMDERVKGKITVYSPTKLSTDEAFNVFTSVLELKGFTLIQVGKVYKIVPTSSAKQSGTKLYSERDAAPVNESYIARVITLDNIPAQDAVTFLQPMVSKDGHVSAFGPANMLLLVDSSINVQKLLNILAMIDTEKLRYQAEVLYLKNAAAETTAKLLNDWLGSKAQKPAGQQAQSTIGVTIIPDNRLNALFVFGSTEEKDDIRKLVALIDVAPPNSSSKVNVYPLENADATEVSKVLDGVVKGSTAAAAASPGQGGAQQQSPFDGGRITITPDKATNSLIIMASPTDYQNLLQVIQKLDKRRRQVFVEAIIAEVSLNKLQDLGVQWGVLGGAAGRNTTVAGTYDPQGAFSSLFETLSALKAAGISIPDLTGTAVNFAVVLKALESNGIINVLSTPNILTSDNKEAEIFVGENVPFRGNVTISNTTNPSYQSIERKDTGITLKLTPQISEGEYVKLDIYQEISAIENTTVTGAADLITTKRSAKTSVVVKDKETVAIGGLIQDRNVETVSQVPLLGDIPLLGWLFKYKSTTRQKTNLMIMLTPRVVKDARDLAELSTTRNLKFGEAAQRTQPLDIPAELKK